MEVLSMTDKQWKGWLRRFKRDLEDLKEAKDEKERQKGLRRLSREGGLATALHQKKYNKYGISCK